MINPKDFISNGPKQNNYEDLIDMSGQYSCPEHGCYEVSKEGKFNERERVVTWVCSNGHLGRARI